MVNHPKPKVSFHSTPIFFVELGSADLGITDGNMWLQDSVYYHPTLNPTGAPPPGKPPMFKSSVGPRIPLSVASSSGTASSSKSDAEDGSLSTLPTPPSPPPLPQTGDADSVDRSAMPASLPLPPPPPMPPKPAVRKMSSSLPLLPFPPPPPPGPTPKEQVAAHLPLPPPHLQPSPPSPGTGGSDRNKNNLDNPSSVELMQPPLVPGLPLKSDSTYVESDVKASIESKVHSKLQPLPLRQQPSVPGANIFPTLHPDVLPPRLPRFPPPPWPTEMRPQPGVAGQPVPPRIMLSLMQKPPFGPPPDPPSMMRPPLPPGPPPFLQDGARPPVPQKPSYVKSAASTVVKRPLAQHTPELTSMASYFLITFQIIAYT